MRVCACGCGASLEGRRPSTLYALDACKSRAWRNRTGYTLKGRKAPQPTSNACQTRRERAPDMRISYAKAREALIAALWHTHGAETIVDRALRQLLSERQRRHLEARDG